MQTSEMKPLLSELLGRSIISIQKIGGGRNSKVYRLTCEGSDQYAAKFYFRHSLDNRDRLGVEFSGLQFLWQNGVRCISRPIAADRDHGCAVYEYVYGNKISSQEVSDSDIDYAVHFLARLNELKTKKGSRNLHLASEACFSVMAIVNNIELRLNRLSIHRSDDKYFNALHEFLTNDFIPSFDKIKRWCKSNLKQSGISIDTELPYEERTLNPSDFGFHNALRRGDGKVVFLDFEYFGWDDPAKMICDFLLHPAMELREELKQRFITNVLSHFRDHRHLAERVEIVYPLFGFKWCMIFLDEFVPEHLLRRRFASEVDINKDAVQAEQLTKSRRILDRVMNEYEHFPYRN